MSSRTLLFPDTNVFLQCKVLGELPWTEGLLSPEIELLIGEPVLDEIDRLKGDGNRRRASRARDTNGLFRELLACADGFLTIRESAPRVILRFAPPLPLKRDTPETLDLSRADDRLIDEVLYFRRTEPCVQIMTNDTGVQLRCRRYEVPVFAVRDSWLLPLQKDERDKEIEALKSERDRLRMQEASLSVSIQREDGLACDRVSESRPYYPELSGEEITRLLAEVRQRHPQAADSAPPASDTLGVTVWRAPTQDQITRYRQEYEKWVDTARKEFERLAAVSNARHRVLKLRILLSNTGIRPADELLLELSVHGNAKICAAAVGDGKIPDVLKAIQQLPETVVLEEPPAPPRYAMLSDVRGGRTLNIPSLLRNSAVDPSNIRLARFNRDRHEFYRREDNDEPGSAASFTCEEFRHQRAPGIFNLWLFAHAQPGTVKARLHVRASARNMSAAVEQHVLIEIESVPQSTYDVAGDWHVKATHPDS